MTSGNNICPFCRTPAPTSDEESLEREKKRAEVGDAVAIHNRACCYDEGMYDFPQDWVKALELWHQAGELGHAAAYCNVGNAYLHGEGVERDEKKADHYAELAAIGGDVFARYNLGNMEVRAGNMERAIKHFMIATGSGHDASLQRIKQLYLSECATKDNYAKALKAYLSYLVEVKSDDRDKAAEYDEKYKYYE